MKFSQKMLAATVAALALPLLFAAQPTQAQTETVLYNFSNVSGGTMPYGKLTSDASGNFYGTTWEGGGDGQGAGAVFELSPEPAGGCASGSNVGNGWCETVLYSFCSAVGCTDGSYPYLSYVTFDEQGNLYGTTSYGGSNNYGTVFELSPEPLSGCPGGTNPGSGWCETVLYSFCSLAGCADGELPVNGLVRDSSGNLYGVGTTDTSGTVYELSPNGSGGWTEQVIYSYAGSCACFAGLAIDASGDLYGVDGAEHVFKLSFTSGAWAATNIHTFTGEPKDGSDPYGTPAVDSAGNVYGTTFYGGSKNLGTVWKLTQVTKGKKAGTYTEKILHSFTSDKTGANPWAGVTLDSSGNIYGTTYEAGKYGYGAVFELAVSGTAYKYEPLWSFNGTDGSLPYDSPTLDSSGNVYGTTAAGGSDGNGTVFEVKP